MSPLDQGDWPAANGRPETTAFGRPNMSAEVEMAEVVEARARREQISMVIGIVAERYAITPAEAWELLVGVSQGANVKLREVTRLIHDSACRRLAVEDHELAGRLNRLAPTRRPLVGELDSEGHHADRHLRSDTQPPPAG